MAFKKNNPGCTCCSCIFCTTDNFDRADNDVTVGAPINWVVLSGTFVTESNVLKISEANSILMLDQELDLGPTQEYIIKYDIKAIDVDDEVMLLASMGSSTDFYAGVYKQQGGSAELHLYRVAGGSLSDFEELNSQFFLPDINNKAGAYLKLTVNLDNSLIEVAIVDDDGSEYACVGPYLFNGGNRVGVGAANLNTGAGHTIKIDNFSVCENKCLTGCLIDVDFAERADSLAVGTDWFDTGTGTGTDPQSLEDQKVQIFGEQIYFNKTDSIYFATPHPDSHHTMGVSVDVTCFGPSPISAIKQFGIYVLVDDPENPQNWIRVQWDGTGGGTLKVYMAQAGSETLLGSVANDLGTNLGGDLVAVFRLYVCVDNYDRVFCYGTHGTSNTYLGLLRVQIPDTATNLGYYTGLFANTATGPFGVQYLMDNFTFIKSYHPGIPQIQSYTFGGDFEPTDYVHLQITKIGDHTGSIDESDVVESVTIGLSGSGSGSGNPSDYAALFLAEIMALDPGIYPVIRDQLQWEVDGSDPNSLLSSGEFDYTVVFTSSEDGTGSVAADDQTVSTELVQAWVQGASKCPFCPPICDPCSLCDGPLAQPPNDNTPRTILFTLGGTLGIYNPFTGYTAQRPCWNSFAPPAMSEYGPPFYHVPASHQCYNEISTFPGESEYNSACEGFDGSYVLEGCGCLWAYGFPTWFEHHYPNVGCTGPPGNYVPCATEPNPSTCYPGTDCDGFILQAQVVAGTGALIKWIVYLESSTNAMAHYVSEEFPADECKLARQLTLDTVTYPFDNIGFCVFPLTAQLDPID